MNTAKSLKEYMNIFEWHRIMSGHGSALGRERIILHSKIARWAILRNEKIFIYSCITI